MPRITKPKVEYWNVKCLKKSNGKFSKVWFDSGETAEAAEFCPSAMNALKKKVKGLGINFDEWEKTGHKFSVKYAIGDLKKLYPFKNCVDADDESGELGFCENKINDVNAVDSFTPNNPIQITINELVRYKVTGLDIEWKMLLHNRIEKKADILHHEYDSLPTTNDC